MDRLIRAVNAAGYKTTMIMSTLLNIHAILLSCHFTFSSRAAILSFKCSCKRSLDSVRSLSTVSDNLLLCSSFIFSLCLALHSRQNK